MTILIVDDEEIVRRLVRVALRGSVDAVFLEANNAAEALKIAREYCGHIDLLISDVVMPGRINGSEMAAQLSRTRPDMKVFLMSGYAPEAVTIEPNWSFIQKPFSMLEIQERIGSIVTENFVAV